MFAQSQNVNLLVAGTFIWVACLCHENKTIKPLKGTYDILHNQKALNVPFEYLNKNRMYKLCVAFGMPNTVIECNNTCQQDRHYELFNCKVVETKCVPLKPPKKKPMQVDWTPDDNFNPFTEVRIELEEETFEGENSGLKDLLIL